jgi:leader peptidase (prepilin peptidase)/N-methyltransferase
MTWFLPLVALWLGAVVGSFLNVVIHRYPREESVVFPPSRCPACSSRIRPYDNVPIVSYFLLLGRCRDCSAPISPRYPLVEAANGLFYVAILQRTGPTSGFIAVAALVSMTIVLIFIDAEIQILPDAIDLPGTAIGLGLALGAGGAYPALVLASSWQESLIGALMGSGILLAIGLTYQLVRKIEGLGLGDVKMMAMLGAALGWAPLFALLLLASVSASVVGLFVAARSELGMKVPLPFGVFLGFSFLVTLFFGRETWSAYMSLLVG